MVRAKEIEMAARIQHLGEANEAVLPQQVIDGAIAPTPAPGPALFKHQRRVGPPFRPFRIHTLLVSAYPSRLLDLLLARFSRHRAAAALAVQVVLMALANVA